MLHRLHPLFTRRPLTSTLLPAFLGCLILAGCSGDATPQLAADFAAADPPGPGTQHSVAIEPADLAERLDTVFRELGWAAVRVNHDDEHLRARALLPDGREAAITAIAEDDDDEDADNPVNLQLHIRVGHFGSPHMETRFLDALRHELE